MIHAGMEAVVIKVAGIGLKPNHLGRTLAEMQPILINLVNYLFLAPRYIYLTSMFAE
jgi:diphthine-ammonia ligase